MRISRLYYSAILSVVWANPNNSLRSDDADPTDGLFPVQTSTLNQDVAEDSEMQFYCPHVYLDLLTNRRQTIEEGRDESPNNKLPYTEFRRLARKHYIDVEEFYDAVERRRDPELLKVFHLTFNDAYLGSPVTIHGPGPAYWTFLGHEADAEKAELRAERALEYAMEAIDSAEEARDLAEVWRVMAQFEESRVREKQEEREKAAQAALDEH